MRSECRNARWRQVVCGAMVIGGLALASVGGAASASAEESVIDLSAHEAMQKTLEAQVGKRVKLRLASGHDLEGKIAKVGAHAVVVTEVAGMELFDATVRMDQVAAVLVRERTK